MLCSACLLGLSCRYDGKSRPNNKVIELIKDYILIPFCPEQLGGLPTPRECAEIIGTKVFTRSGKDVTQNFIQGAKETLYIAKLLGIKRAILKQYSPSCGCGKIYDGSFSRKIIKGDGVTTKLLKEEGIFVISDEDLIADITQKKW
ncbi:2-thiouracil desulfurase family protein [Desulfothermus naphthae]